MPKTRPKKKTRDTRELARLRERAEARLEKSPEAVSETPAGDVQNLVHELRVHQAELEMQNEELRRVQLDLENSRDRFAHLYDLAPVGYLTLDAEGVIREANLTAARLLSLDRRALLKKQLSRFITAESQDDFYLHRQQVFTTGTQQTCELQMRLPDEAVFTGRLECIVETAAQGVSSQCLVALSDVTRHRQAENAMRESQAQLAGIIRSAMDAILTVNSQQRIVLCNEAAERMFGRSSGQLMGQPLDDLIPKAARRTHAKHIRSFGATGVTNRQMGALGKVSGLRADGTEFPIEASISQVELGGQKFLTVILRDISRRVELEREILRISELEQHRLGMELHDDVCQQLTGIEFLAYGLEQELSTKSKADTRYASRIARLLREANSCVRNLSHGLAPAHLDTEGLVGILEGLALWTRQVFRSDCRVQCDQPVTIEDPEIRLHLYRIAREAVSNAIKHGRAKRIDIRLKANGDRVVLGIHDNGVGLPKTPRRGQGMGLRLMQYRAGLIAGSLAVRREASSGGTAVVCSIHLANARPKGAKKK